MLPWDAEIGVFISELPKHSKKYFPLFFLKKCLKNIQKQSLKIAVFSVGNRVLFLVTFAK
jgi:hypothetical protein